MPSKKTMDELVAAAAALNQASDDLNELIESIEDQFQRAGVGITHWLGEASYEPSSCLLAASKASDPDDESHLVADGWMLGHAKIEAKWRIAVKRVAIDIYPRANPDEQERPRDIGKAMPLLKAPREVRVDAASMLEELAQALTQRMKQHLEDIARAKKLARDNDEPGKLQWHERLQVHIRNSYDGLTPRKFRGAPVEYAKHMSWELLAAGPDNMVLVKDSNGQQVAIGRSPTDSNYLLLLLHKPKDE